MKALLLSLTAVVCILMLAWIGVRAACRLMSPHDWD